MGCQASRHSVGTAGCVDNSLEIDIAKLEKTLRSQASSNDKWFTKEDVDSVMAKLPV